MSANISFTSQAGRDLYTLVRNAKANQNNDIENTCQIPEKLESQIVRNYSLALSERLSMNELNSRQSSLIPLMFDKMERRMEKEGIPLTTVQEESLSVNKDFKNLTAKILVGALDVYNKGINGKLDRIDMEKWIPETKRLLGDEYPNLDDYIDPDVAPKYVQDLTVGDHIGKAKENVLPKLVDWVANTTAGKAAVAAPFLAAAAIMGINAIPEREPLPPPTIQQDYQFGNQPTNPNADLYSSNDTDWTFTPVNDLPGVPNDVEAHIMQTQLDARNFDKEKAGPGTRQIMITPNSTPESVDVDAQNACDSLFASIQTEPVIGSPSAIDQNKAQATVYCAEE